MDFPKGSFVAFDRAYSAVKWFCQLCKKEICFVTRFKKGTKFRLIEKFQVDASSGVTSDYVVEMSNGAGNISVRKTGYRDEKTSKHYTFLTNNFDLPAKTIADLHKARCQIEIFFKEIKQFLKIKKFVGTNENAVRIQIYTALTIYLLLAFRKFISKLGISVGRFFQSLQLNLAVSRSIDDILHPEDKKQKKCYDSSLLQYLTS